MSARRHFLRRKHTNRKHTGHRSFSAAVIRAYLSLSYKVDDDEGAMPPQLLTRLIVPLPVTLAGLLYLVFSALLDPIQAAVTRLYAEMSALLYEQYIGFFVWLGAAPPPGYEYFLRREVTVYA